MEPPGSGHQADGAKERSAIGGVGVVSPTYVWGSLDVQELANILKQQGIMDVKVESSPGGHIIDIVSVCADDDDGRRRWRLEVTCTM